MSKPKKKGRSLGTVPIHGHAEYNFAFYTAIGGLVVNWANNESVFLAMLQILLPVGDNRSALIVWHSHRTTRARLELVERLCRQQVKDEALLKDVCRAISNFHGFSRVRNFYCHALYNFDTELRLLYAEGAFFAPQDGPPLTFERRQMDHQALNEIGSTAIKLGEFNRDLWALVERMQISLGVRRVDPPQLPPLQTSNPSGPIHQGTGETPEGTP